MTSSDFCRPIYSKSIKKSRTTSLTRRPVITTLCANVSSHELQLMLMFRASQFSFGNVAPNCTTTTETLWMDGRTNDQPKNSFMLLDLFAFHTTQTTHLLHHVSQSVRLYDYYYYFFFILMELQFCCCRQRRRRRRQREGH